MGPTETTRPPKAQPYIGGLPGVPNAGPYEGTGVSNFLITLFRRVKSYGIVTFPKSCPHSGGVGLNEKADGGSQVLD